MENVLVSPCAAWPLHELRARLNNDAARGDARGVSASRCLTILELLPNGDGVYPVPSLAELLACDCAPDMCKLQECVLRPGGLPVYILRAPARTQTAKVAAATFITLKHNQVAGFKLHEAQRAALARLAPPPPPPTDAVMDILRAWRRGDPNAAVASLVAALGTTAAARYLHVSEDTVIARSAATLRAVSRSARVQADFLEAKCRRVGLTVERATPALRMRAVRRAHRALTLPTVTAFDIADTDADTRGGVP